MAIGISTKLINIVMYINQYYMTPENTITCHKQDLNTSKILVDSNTSCSPIMIKFTYDLHSYHLSILLALKSATIRKGFCSLYD